MNVPISHRKRRVCALLILTLLIALWLTLTVCADTYVGRYDGRVAWSFDASTGELRLYDNCGMQTPLWSGFAESIRSVYVAPGVTQLPRDAFRGCSSLREIILPDTVTSIGAYAFEGCSSLSTLVLPATLRHVGEHVVSGCSALSYVTFRGSSQEWEQLCTQAATLAGNEWLCSTTPVYTRTIYLVTVRFVSAETGAELAPSVERTVTVGADCTVAAPPVEHHTPNEHAVVLRDVRANQSVTVLYYRTHCEVGVRHVDELGNVLLPDGRLTVAQGSSLLLQAPEIEGYELPAEPEVVLTGVMQNGLVHTFRYTRRMLTVRVRCLDEQGDELCEPLVKSVPYRGDYEITLPVIQGYTTGLPSVRGTGLLQSVEQTVTYSPVYHSVTLRYVDEHGNEISAPDVLSVRHGQSLVHSSKMILGYEAQHEQTSLASVVQEQSLDILYRPARYLLTVLHQTTDGTLLTKTSELISYKQEYRCQPLSLTGYALTDGQDAQLSGVMSAAPLTVTLYYRVLSPDTDSGVGDLAPQGVFPPPVLLWIAVGVASAAVLALCIVLIRDVKKRRAAK